MFENPLPVMDFEHTYIERKRFAPSRKSRAKRVCFKTPLPVRVFAISTQREPAKGIDFSKFQKDTGRDTILILVYIHTYPVFARRINIVHLMRASRNPSACHGKR